MADDVIVKVRTVIDKNDADEMEESLNRRFTKVSTKFTTGLVRGLKKVAVSGIIAGAVGALLNDINKLNSAIDDTLEKYKDIQSKASAQNLDPAEYYKLSRVSEIAGVQNFDAIFNTFREEMEKVNRGMASPLSQFRGEPINADTFLQVISSLQAAPKQVRQLATQEVFGGNAKEVNKLLTTDLQQIATQTFTGISDEQINQAIARGTAASRQQMILETRRELENLDVRSRIINGNLLGRQDTFRRREDQLTTQQLGTYDTAAVIQTKMLEAQNQTVKATDKAVGWLGKIYDGIKSVASDLKQSAAIDVKVRRGLITQEEGQKLQEELFR